MNELRKYVVCFFVAVLIFYMIRLFYFIKKKWKLKKYTFIVMISGLSLTFIATFLDIFADNINSSIIYNSIKIFFALGAIVYIIGIILWTNFTKETMIKLEKITLIDPMTGAFNRRGMERIYDSAVKAKKPFYFMVCDLDGTKKINDTYGHIEGDKYINEVTKIVTNVIGLKGALARIGGDEFVIILENIEIEELEKNISTIKKQAYEIYKDENIGISIGWALFPDHGKTLIELMKLADEKMYEDKKLKLGKV